MAPRHLHRFLLPAGFTLLAFAATPAFGGGWAWGYSYPGPYASAWVRVPGPVYIVGGDGKELPATVITKIKPHKAAVVVDGEAVGKAGDFDGDWNVLYLEPGKHVIEFSRPGYKTLRTVLDARAGAHYRIREGLDKGEGLDERSASVPPPPPPTAPAPAPRADEGPAHSAGSHELRTGLLWLRATPSDATVYLDGRFLGNAEELERLHGAIPLARGEHRIDVVMPGYVSQTRRVAIDGGEPAEVRIDLKRDGR